jgi:hypothetical protein
MGMVLEMARRQLAMGTEREPRRKDSLLLHLHPYPRLLPSRCSCPLQTAGACSVYLR